MKKKKGYYRGIEKDMYIYFVSYDEAGAPSFSKFARRQGLTLAELEGYRRRKLFDKAYNECSEIRRDYLKDSALTKRHDPSFVKYLLETETNPSSEAGDVKFTLEVI